MVLLLSLCRPELVTHATRLEGDKNMQVPFLSHEPGQAENQFGVCLAWCVIPQQPETIICPRKLTA